MSGYVYVTPEAADAIVEAMGFHYRDRGLMISALGGPMPVFGHDPFPDLHEKAAVLLKSINRNHPLLDGNKRVSWLIVTFFYAENGYNLWQAEDEFEATDMIIRGIAKGGDEPTLDWIAHWLEGYAQPM